ncbi:MAG: hypothetical protein AAFZ74_02155 [Pseudomonadota bacterium]
MTPDQIIEREKQREREEAESLSPTPDSIIASEKSRLANSASGSFYTMRQTEPDRASKVISLSERLGAERDFVDRNLETMEETAAQQERDDLLAQFPKVSQFFSDPYRAAEAKDSVPNFAEIERLYSGRNKKRGWLEAPFSQAGDLGRSFAGDAVGMFGQGVRGAGDLVGGYVGFVRGQADKVPGLREGLAAIDEAEAEFAPDAKILAPQNYLRTAGGGVADLGDIIRPEDMEFEDKVAGALGQIVGAVLTTMTAGPSAATGLFMGMGADQQGQAMRDAGLNPDDMFPELVAGAGVTGLSEQMRLGSIMRMMPREARNRVASNVISRILGQAGEEAIQEGTEGVLQNLITTTYDADASLFEGVTDQMTTAGVAAGVFQAFVEAALPGRSRGARAESNAQELMDIREVIEQTPVFQRSRESIETFLQQAGEGETILLHGEDLVELYQSDPEVFMQRMDEVGLTEDDISSAMDGHDIEVEAARVLSVSEGFEDWVKIAKADEDAPTLREMEREAEESDAMGAVDFTEAFERIAGQDEALEGFERVQSAVTEQLLGAGRGQAESEAAGAVWGAMFRQLAESGVDESAVFERLGLRINEPAPARMPKPQEPQTLHSYVRSLGGIREAFGEDERGFMRGEIDARLGERVPGLINNASGVALDEIFRAATEEGGYDIRDEQELLDLIERDLSGERVYPLGEGEVYSAELEAYEAQFDAPDGEVMNQAAEAGYEGSDRGEAAEWLAAKAKGLDMSQDARMERAREMGFDTETVLYHGTPDNRQLYEEGFKTPAERYAPDRERSGPYYFTDSQRVARTYANDERAFDYQNAVPEVVPLYLKIKNPLIVNAMGRRFDDMDRAQFWDAIPDDNLAKTEYMRRLKGGTDPFHTDLLAFIAKDMGYDGVVFKNVIDDYHGEGKPASVTAVFDPSNIRSVNAAFDPAMSDSANLLHQLAGPRSKGAEKKILKHAKKMARKKKSRQEIWDETAEMGQPWYQDENGDWITEFEDRSVVVKSEKGKAEEVIEYPALYENYPEIGKQRADARGKKVVFEETGDPDVVGTAGTYTASPLFWKPHIRISDQGKTSAEYTAVHELQHAIDHIEKRKNTDRRKSYALQPTERRAFNVMYRHLWTMEERIEIPPWETEQEAIDWFLGGRAEWAKAAEHMAEGTYDPFAVIRPSDPVKKWRESLDTEMDNSGQGRAMREPTGGDSWDIRARTFLSVKEAKRNLHVLQEANKDPVGQAQTIDREADNRMNRISEEIGQNWGYLKSIYKRGEERAAAHQKDDPISYPHEGFEEIMAWSESLDWDSEKGEVVPDGSLPLSIGHNEIAEIISVGIEDGKSAAEVIEDFRETVANEVKWDVVRGNIDADAADLESALSPEHMLDLDEDFDGQSKRVQSVLSAMIDQVREADEPRSGWEALPTGKLLSHLSDGFGRMPQVIERLQENEIYGGFYLSGGKKSDGPPQFQSVLIFDNTAPQVQRNEDWELLQRQDNQPRASVLVPGEGVLSDQDVLVKLTKTADRTSFLHESAHVFLELYSALEGENEVIAERMGAIRKWLKIKPGEKITRDQHEKFAESFEAYLMEGVAPSAELRGVFHSFRQWFVDVYRRLRGQLRNLEPEARDIFDRMLASDAEIEMAQGQYVGTLSKAMEGLMTPEQVEKYQKHALKAGNVARDKLFKKHIAEVKRREKAAYKEERDRVEDMARQQLNDWPEYKTLAAFGEGGRTLKASLSPTETKLKTSENGEHPEIVAPEMGFANADAMFKAVQKAAPFERVLKGAVDKIMGDRYGDMLRDGTIESEAMEAVFNEPTIRMMEAERNALAAKASGQSIPLISIRQEADRLINTMPIDQVIKPGRYAIKARDLHKRSLRAAAKGKWDDALRYTHQAMLQHELARRAFKARDEIERGNRLLARFAAHRKLDPKKIAPAYITRIRELIRLPGAENQAELREGLNKFADEQALEGYAVVLPSDVLGESDLPIRRRMTMEQFREYRDAVKNLNKLGRQQSEEVMVEFRAEAQSLAYEIVSNYSGKLKRETRNPTRLERFTETLRNLDASVLRWPFLIESLQGGKSGKIIEAFETPLRQAIQDRNARREDMTDALRDIMRKHKISQSELNKRVNAPVIEDGNVRFGQVLAVALNMGTEQNRARLVADPSMRGDMAAIEAMLADHLEQRHWDAAQEIWDLLNTMWPDASAVERRETGVAPKKVEAASVETPFGTYRGGYYPLKYDRGFMKNTDLERQDVIEEWKQGVNGMATRASTDKGFLKERQENVRRPLRLDLTVILEHIDQVTNDIYMREPASRISRLLARSSIRGAITQTQGKEYLRPLEEILKRSVVGTRRVDNAFESLIRTGRVNASVALLGLNVTTAMLAPISYMQTVIPRYGAGPILRGMAGYYGLGPFSMIRAAKEISSKSVFMRERENTINREAHERIRKNSVQTRFGRIQGAGYWLMSFIEKHSVSGPLWMGVYNQALDQGASEREAILKADRAVATTQGSGLELDQSILQGGSEMDRLLTFMWGYVSNMYGIARNDITKSQNLNRVFQVFKHFILLNVAASMLEALIRDGFGDEDDPYVENVLTLMQRNVLGMLPGLAPFFSKYDSGPSSLQAGADLGHAGERFFSAGHDYFEEGEVDGEAVKSGLRAAGTGLGLLFGIPGTLQLARIEKTLTEDDDPTLYEALITGPDDDN